MSLIVTNVLAQPNFKIRVTPDVKEIRIGSGVKDLTLRVDYKGDLKFQWHLSRDRGELRGDKESSAIGYILPDEIIEELAIQDKPEEVTITVSVTDVSGKSAQASENFKLLASVEQLGKIAQNYFDNRCFMDTAGKSVQCKGTTINVCKKILAIEADNAKALDLLRKMKNFYQQWGDDARKDGKITTAKSHYENYLAVANYLSATEIEAEKQDVENKLADLKMMDHEKELREKLQRYRELQKQNGKNEAFLDSIMALAKIFGETDIDSFHTRVDRMLRMERPKMGSSLQEFDDRFAQLYRDFDSSQKEKNQRKEIIQTLRILATLRELQRVYEHFSPKEDLGPLNNKIERYEERFLK